MIIKRETRHGALTTEFWLVVAANVLVQADAIPVPDKYRWIVLAATVAGYSLSRGLSKLGVPAITVAPDSAAEEEPVAAPRPRTRKPAAQKDS